jgi:hypothetical protein
VQCRRRAAPRDATASKAGRRAGAAMSRASPAHRAIEPDCDKPSCEGTELRASRSASIRRAVPRRARSLPARNESTFRTPATRPARVILKRSCVTPLSTNLRVRIRVAGPFRCNCSPCKPRCRST